METREQKEEAAEPATPLPLALSTHFISPTDAKQALQALRVFMRDAYGLAPGAATYFKDKPTNDRRVAVKDIWPRWAVQGQKRVPAAELVCEGMDYERMFERNWDLRDIIQTPGKPDYVNVSRDHNSTNAILKVMQRAELRLMVDEFPVASSQVSVLLSSKAGEPAAWRFPVGRMDWLAVDSKGRLVQVEVKTLPPPQRRQPGLGVKELAGQPANFFQMEFYAWLLETVAAAAKQPLRVAYSYLLAVDNYGDGSDKPRGSVELWRVPRNVHKWLHGEGLPKGTLSVPLPLMGTLLRTERVD